MLELKAKPNAILQAKAPVGSQQPRRLVLALVLLLVTFVALIVKDRQFWFGADESLDADLAQPEAAQPAPANVAPNTATARTTPAPAAKKAIPAAGNSAPAKPADSAATAIHRTALPPLDVEVIAGDSHRTVHPGSNATKVEITNPKASSKTTEFTAKVEAPTNAAELGRMPAAPARPALGSFDGSYPLLAQQMQVQGSVVLQALIGTDGIIQHLRVLKGPGILASAARQAVREWRFKPYVENGQAVETKATITVNFTIKVADSATTTASLTPSSLLITQMAE